MVYALYYPQMENFYERDVDASHQSMGRTC